MCLVSSKDGGILSFKTSCLESQNQELRTDKRTEAYSVEQKNPAIKGLVFFVRLFFNKFNRAHLLTCGFLNKIV